ncbi:hypothetical protein GU3_16364 (plasmid) [Oceanimonas sp. GK1]|uniref:hypothetical protein n=1 Tax=Oceanimonas sp. (strain GK1 / IBRC-M 10197) TaxID=511062 RepID=UPI000249560E|nr:hypothetical protein [Oceanimonas sp. GK1]AEY02978.1 hypothetical protein GU3_16364 [Oceanimonas sp. GK1]
MNELTITLVAILFPGVLLTVIHDNYTEHRPWDPFRYTLYSIVSGIITYSTLQGVIFLAQLLYNIEGFRETEWYTLSVWGILESGNKEKIKALEVVSAGLIGVILGLISVKVSQQNIIHNLLIKWNLTNKYGDTSVFVKTIEITQKEYIRVTVLDEGLTLEGVAQIYHDDGTNQEIALGDVVAYDTSSGDELFKANLLYISKPFGNLMIHTSHVEETNLEQGQDTDGS